jgi:hypothetical protein
MIIRMADGRLADSALHRSPVPHEWLQLDLERTGFHAPRDAMARARTRLGKTASVREFTRLTAAPGGQ